MATTQLSRAPADQTEAPVKPVARGRASLTESNKEAAKETTEGREAPPAISDLDAIREGDEEDEEEPMDTIREDEEAPAKDAENGSNNSKPECGDADQAAPENEEVKAKDSEDRKALSSGIASTSGVKHKDDNPEPTEVEHIEVFPLRRIALFPEALTPRELYGFKHEQSGWHDGVFPTLLRYLQEKEATKVRYFVVLDGDVSPEWTDILQPALEPAGRREITLSNGESCRVPESVTFVLETVKLWDVSPGLVGRCGVCAMDDALSWTNHVEVFMERMVGLLPDHAESLKVLIPILCDGLLPFVRKHCAWASEATIVQSFVCLCSAVLSERNGVTSSGYQFESLQLWLVYASIWSFGSLLELSDRAEFGMHLVKLFRKQT